MASFQKKTLPLTRKVYHRHIEPLVGMDYDTFRARYPVARAVTLQRVRARGSYSWSAWSVFDVPGANHRPERDRTMPALLALAGGVGTYLLLTRAQRS